MKALRITMLACLLSACSSDKLEEFVFKQTLEFSLVELCEGDETCKKAVKEQISPCMEKSDWRTFLNNEDDEAELARFTQSFYSCIVDGEGDPYFESTV